jgi:hypothetical protein
MKQNQGKRNPRKSKAVRSMTRIAKDDPSAIVNISRWRITPPRMLVKLAFQEERTLANAGSTNTSFRFSANGAFDIDPSVGNLTMNGFNQWLAMYGVYRVVHFKCKNRFNNLCAFPVRVATGFFPQTHFPFLSTEFGANQWCEEHQTLGPLTGQGRLSTTRQIEIAKLIGVEAYQGDLNQYYGTTSSNPTSLCSFNIAAYTTGGNLFVAGISVVSEIEMIVELSYPTPLLQV